MRLKVSGRGLLGGGVACGLRGLGGDPLAAEAATPQGRLRAFFHSHFRASVPASALLYPIGFPLAPPASL